MTASSSHYYFQISKPTSFRIQRENTKMMPSLIKSKKRRHKVLPAPSLTPCPALSSLGINSSSSSSRMRSMNSSSSSSSIPIPKSHIHRTPSELQLADEVRRAEIDDVRMYARLLTGMQHQLQREFRANGGVVHPLSKKSLQGIVKTKHATYDEIDGELFYTTEDEENDTRAIQHHPLPWSTRMVRDGLPPSQSNSDCSLSTLDSLEAQVDEDDVFVFDLEL